MKKLVLATALAFALSACAPPPPPQMAAACPALLKSALQFNLYFGRETADGRQVSEVEWVKFLADEVTPRFPDGLSVIDVAGQSRESSGRMAREKTKLLVVVVFDAPAHLPKVQAVVDAYNKRYGQHGVFRTEHSVCAGV